MIDKLTLSIEEAAHAIGLSPWTIRKYVALGKLKATHIGRRVLIEPCELRRLIDAGRGHRAPGDKIEKVEKA